MKKRVLLYVVASLWMVTARGQLEVVNNARMIFNGKNIINVSQSGNVGPTAGKNFSLSPGLFIERTSGNSSGGIFISEATAVVLWAGSLSNCNLVEFGKNPGGTSQFQTIAYINSTGDLLKTSDSTLKTDITRLGGITMRLQGIGAYRYHLRSQFMGTAIEDSSILRSSTATGVDSSGIQPVGGRMAQAVSPAPSARVADTAAAPYCIGLMAQEVEKAFPELVENHEGIKYVNYMGMVPILLQAINEQQAVISQQQKKLQEQEARIAALQAEVAAIKKYLKIK